MRYREFTQKILEGFNHLDPDMRGGLAKSGDRLAIKELQQWLNDNGYDAGEVDGMYGGRTARAVRKFQKDADITVDGDAGPMTIKAMMKASGKSRMTKKGLSQVKPTVDPGLTKGIEDDDIHKAAKGEMEDFLGDSIGDSEYEMLIRATAAEASPDAKERAGVLAVMLNRVRSGRYPNSVKGVLTQRNQFQAVTGTRFDRGPSRNFSGMSESTGRAVARDIVQYLGGMDKGWLNFTSNNPKAYGRGTNINFMYAMRKSPGAEVIGQTVFGTA